MTKKTATKRRRLSMTLLPTTLFFLTALWLVPRVGRAGYCQGWWGKESLAMRSLWMCTCGEGFEQSLYPENVEVLYSACQENIQISPLVDGNFVISGDNNFNDGNHYLLDGYTGFKEKIDIDSHTQFITSELILLHTPEKTLLNRNEGWKAKILYFVESPPSPFLNNGQVNSELIALFENSATIYYFAGGRSLIALGKNPQQDYEKGSFYWVIPEEFLNSHRQEWPDRFFKEANLPALALNRLRNSISPNEDFEARDDGIYARAGISVISPPRTFQGSFYCWFPDSRSAIYLPSRFDPTNPYGRVNPLDRLIRLSQGTPQQTLERNFPILRLHIPTSEILSNSK